MPDLITAETIDKLITDAIDHAFLATGNIDVGDDVFLLIEFIFNGVEKVISRDSRFPQLRPHELDDLFHDLRREAERRAEEFSEIDVDYLKEDVTNAAIAAMHEEQSE